MLRDEEGRDLILGVTPIKGGKGGDGEIWPVVNRPDVVFKRYHRLDKLADRALKVAFMRENPPRFLQGESHKAIAWPISAVLEQGQFVGFLMVNATDCRELVDFCKPALVGVQGRKDPWRRFDRKQKSGMVNRLLLCYNLCVALRSLHRSGQYVHGDIKPKNVLVADNGHIRIIDIDSIQICRGHEVLFPALVTSRTYRPKVFRTQAKGNIETYQLKPTWDGFSFAVTCYEILVGIHPYHASHPTINNLDEAVMEDLFVHGTRRAELLTIPEPHKQFRKLPTALQELFQDSFATQAVDLAQWRAVLKQEIDQRTDSYLDQPKFIFRADPNPVVKGEQTTLYWKVANAQSAKIRGIGAVPLEGQQTVKVSRAKTFELIAHWAKGKTTKHLSVGLRKALILAFVARIPTVAFGEEAEIQWQLDPSFVGAHIERVNQPNLTVTDPVGQAYFPIEAETIFTLAVLGVDGHQERAQTTVRTRRMLRTNDRAERHAELRQVARERPARTLKTRKPPER